MGKSDERARRRRAARKKKTIIQLCILGVLVVGLFVVALLVTGIGRTPASSSLPSSVVQSSQPAPSSSAPSVPQRTATPYDEGDAPPLYNFENYIPDSYTSWLADNLITVADGHQMAPRAGQAFMDMREAALADGIDLAPVSGYRSNARQTNNYNASIQRYLDQGYTREKAVELTEGYYAIPGTSEHEAGLAMDIGWIEDSFEDSDAFAWLGEHAVEYGFILRYHADTFDITRIRYEPWHYRYVGANHAEQMQELGLRTLEEYVQWLQQPDAAS